MNYSKHYNSLVSKCQLENVCTGVYYERHHIIPRCIGGSDDLDNLVFMTPEQHYIAHLLLVKINKGNIKLLYAANMMQNRTHNNKSYGWVKREFSRIERESKLGVKRSVESINKQKETIRKKIASGDWAVHQIGRVTSDETRQRMSIAHKGKDIPIESRSSLEGFIARYGEDEGSRRYIECNAKKSNTLSSYITRYGDDGKALYEEHSRSKALTLENMVSKYGEVDGQARWDAYINNLKNSFTAERKREIGQRTKENIAGRVWANNGTKTIRVKEDEIPYGFVKGRGPKVKPINP